MNDFNGRIPNSYTEYSTWYNTFCNGQASSLHHQNYNLQNSFDPRYLSFSLTEALYNPRNSIYTPMADKDSPLVAYCMNLNRCNQVTPIEETSRYITYGHNRFITNYIPPRTRRRAPSCIECVFCKNNKCPKEVYTSHVLRDPTGRVHCPYLRQYNCPICKNGGGDYAHTLKYCPKNRPSEWQKKHFKYQI